MSRLFPKDKRVVHYSASCQGDECFPSIRLEFEREDGTTGIAFRDLTDRGTFPTLGAAMAAAERVVVESVTEKGIISFRPGK